MRFELGKKFAEFQNFDSQPVIDLPLALFSGEAETDFSLGACRTYREAVTDISPGLQPWVCSPSKSALKGRPNKIAVEPSTSVHG